MDEKELTQKKPSLTHSEMMKILYTTLSKSNRNIVEAKDLERTNNNENLIEVTFLKASPKK